MIENVVVVGLGERQENGHALVCGVALAHVVGKHRQPLDLREQRVGLAAVAVELPVVGAARLANDEHQRLGLLVLERAFGVKPEIFRCLLIFHRCRLPAERHAEVADSVQRKHVVGGRVGGKPREQRREQQRSCRGKEGRQAQRLDHGPVGPSLLRPQRGGERNGGHIYNHHPHDGREQL